MKRGFTLVELSIVLVVIGLLIGGILAAQSMVSTAKITRAVKQLSEYDVAISNFRERYKGWPGDKSGLGADTCAYGGQICNDGVVFTAYVWRVLSLGVGLKNSKGSDYIMWDGYSTADEDACPKFKLPQDESFAPCLTMHLNSGTNLGRPTYMYSLSNVNAAVWWGRPILRPIDALAIDKKLDDGSPFYTGIVSADGTNCSVGNEYDTSYDDYACTIYVVVGIANGTNQ